MEDFMTIKTLARRIPLTRALRDFTRVHVGGMLQRFAQAIDSIQVELRDRNGRRGGGDKRCRIRVQLATGAPILVEEEQANIRRAIQIATGRAAQQLHAIFRRADPGAGLHA
jgi:putative sigma-54 modulation protein